MVKDEKGPVKVLVSRGHTPFCKRGKGSGNFFYSSLLHRSVQCVTNHSTVFCHMSAAITTSIGNYKCKSTVKPQAAALSVIMRPKRLHNASK